MPLSDRQLIERLYRFGHFINPANTDAKAIGGPRFEDAEKGTILDIKLPPDLFKLTLNDKVVKEAVRSYQEQMGYEADYLANKYYARPMVIDGEVGQATRELIEISRCAVPDYLEGAEPAVGTGSWQRCHGVGNYHRAKVRIDHDTMPDFLKPHWQTVWQNTRIAYAALGLDWVETTGDDYNTSITWVKPDGGWIGLAIVGRSQSCGSKIWSRYDRNYRGGNTAAAIIVQWTSLVKHELGHNCGLQHSRGGVMNPSIVNGLPTMWDGDPSEPQLKRWFGGEKVPGVTDPLPPVDPPPGPNPPTGDNPFEGSRIILPSGKRFIVVPERVV